MIYLKKKGNAGNEQGLEVVFFHPTKAGVDEQIF